MSRADVMNLVRKLLIPLIIVVLIRGLFQLFFFNNMEHKAQDSMFRFRGTVPVSDDIVIVAIDDDTIQSLNRQWPFPREFHAKLIDNLVLGGARQIVIDIQITEYSNPSSDATLANSASQAGNVIFPGKYIVSSDNPNHQQMQTPIQPLLAEGVNWGIVNMPLGRDGFIREYTLFEMMGDERFYSLGIAALANSRLYLTEWQNGVTLHHNKLYMADYRIPVVRKKYALINFYGPAETFRHYSYSSVIDDSSMSMPGHFGAETDDFYDLLSSAAFQDKTVLIGATIDELHDKFPTAFSSRLTSGVEIHANFLEMVNRGDYLYEFNFLLFLLIELVLACGVYMLLTWFKPQLSVIFVAIMVALVLVISFYMFIGLNLLFPMVELILMILLLYVSAVVVHYIRSQKEKKFIKSAFQQYMSPELVDELIRNPQSLQYGGSQQEISVLFSDIRSFTPYTEKHQPEETVQILKEYLTAMVDIIKQNKGIVDKFVGDEIMALFGTPVFHADHALQACRTAVEMRKVFDRLQLKWKEEGRDAFEIGIGVNSGIAVVGNLGSEQIFDYTAIGDTINLGARLEDLNKYYAAEKKIIISEETYNRVKDQVEARFLAEAQVKGFDLPVRIYELIDIN
jgi:adenylate cyclase